MTRATLSSEFVGLLARAQFDATRRMIGSERLHIEGSLRPEILRKIAQTDHLTTEALPRETAAKDLLLSLSSEAHAFPEVNAQTKIEVRNRIRDHIGLSPDHKVWIVIDAVFSERSSKRETHVGRAKLMQTMSEVCNTNPSQVALLSPARMCEPTQPQSADYGLNERLDRLGHLGDGAQQQPEYSRAKLSDTDAQWPQDPKCAPDSWHLPKEFAGATFTLTPEVIKGLVAAGHYRPTINNTGNIIIAFRGCEIASGAGRAENLTHIRVRAVQVDHATERCLIGVWHAQTNTISVYRGSTAPHRNAMNANYDRHNFGLGQTMCNLLPMGCYDYTVGTHYGVRGGPLHHVLRQGHGPSPQERATITVLRCHDGLSFDTRSLWDKTQPANNLVPGQMAQGCLTIADGWPLFQRAAGFAGTHYSTRYTLLLSSGHEAAVVAAGQSVACLRHGSQGGAVKRLQSALGLRVDGTFGAHTKLMLTNAQLGRLGYATGTYNAHMKHLLNFAPREAILPRLVAQQPS